MRFLLRTTLAAAFVGTFLVVPHAQRGGGVGPKGSLRVAPRPSHIAVAGQVVHHFGTSPGDEASRLIEVGQVSPAPPGPVRGNDLVSYLPQVGDQVATDEARSAGDQSSHARTVAAGGRFEQLRSRPSAALYQRCSFA